MKIGKLLLLGISAQILVGCSSKTENISFSEDSLNDLPKQVVKSTLINNNLECVYPSNLLATDSLLLIQEPSLAGEDYVNAISFEGQKLATIIHRGQAPFEMANLVAHAVLHPGDTLTAYSNPELGYFPIKDVIDGNTDAVKKIQVPTALRSFAVSDVVPIRDNILACGVTPENRFIVMTPDSQMISTDEFTPITTDKPEVNASAWSYASLLSINPSLNRWVVATYIGGCMEVFELSGNKIKLIGGSYLSKPEYEFHDNQVNWTENTTIGFDALSTTNSKIYALYSGIKGENLKKVIMPVFGNRIIVYDWDCNPLEIIETDCQIKTFAVTPDESMIYAVTLNPDTMGWDLRSFPLRK